MKKIKKAHARLALVMGMTAALLAAASSTALSQDLITQKALPLDLAQAMAQTAVETCRSEGFHVSVTVLDGSGLPKVFLRDEGSGLLTIGLSHDKAYTALARKRPSSVDAKNWATATNPAPPLAGTVVVAGGVPIKVGDEVIGAIGVSGATGGDKDEACASSGIAKFADRLK